jgi:hypothetical protein
MPRARKKTLSGAPAGAATAPVGVPYGEGERRIEAQRRMPVPDFARTGEPAPSAGGTGGGGAAGGGPPADRFAQAMQAAQQMAPPEGLLAMPTQRPMEPLQAGMAPSEHPQGPAFSDALFDLRALAHDYPEYRGLLRLIALAEEQL